ncbi:MAG TPA: RsfS/YbeB/iojap family protein, partial [Candidatus Latescibacteria bacterium]|nr:RsfS/YbeB/iojap family protein [Candidatus Latescibacterota bacterium]
HHREGSAQGGWVLLDFSDIVVHLFHSEQREFYDLEGAWPGGTETVRVQ